MVLVDTSIWVNHLRRNDQTLVRLLEASKVITHPHIIGELSLGSLKNRKTVLSLLRNLPQVPLATDQEVHSMIEHHSLYGKGIGYIDAHLLAGALLLPGTKLWTQDRRLRVVADDMGIAWEML